MAVVAAFVGFKCISFFNWIPVFLRNDFNSGCSVIVSHQSLSNVSATQSYSNITDLWGFVSSKRRINLICNLPLLQFDKYLLSYTRQIPVPELQLYSENWQSKNSRQFSSVPIIVRDLCIFLLLPIAQWYNKSAIIKWFDCALIQSLPRVAEVHVLSYWRNKAIVAKKQVVSGLTLQVRR